MRFRLRTLLIALAPGICAVVGAICSGSASQHHISGDWIPSRDNFLSAAGWGATIGVVASCACAAFLSDSQNRDSLVWWISAIVVGAASGVSYYIFAVSTAAV